MTKHCIRLSSVLWHPCSAPETWDNNSQICHLIFIDLLSQLCSYLKALWKLNKNGNMELKEDELSIPNLSRKTNAFDSSSSSLGSILPRGNIVQWDTNTKEKEKKLDYGLLLLLFYKCVYLAIWSKHLYQTEFTNLNRDRIKLCIKCKANKTTTAWIT